MFLKPIPIESIYKLTSWAVPIILVFVIIAFLVMSWVLEYHWRLYGINDKEIIKIRLIYYVVSIFLVAVMAVATAFYFVA